MSGALCVLCGVSNGSEYSDFLRWDYIKYSCEKILGIPPPLSLYTEVKAIYSQ